MQITYDKFDIGLDRRRGYSVADSNRLRVLKNAYVTTGNAIRKRPGMELIEQIESGTKGLVSAGGYLNTFQEHGGGVSHSNMLFRAVTLVHTTGPAGPYALGDISKIHYGDVFIGKIYAAVEYDDGNTFHYYIDPAVSTTQNLVTDANCPNTKALTKQKSRLFAIDGDTTAFCALDGPTNWTPGALASDPGFLPTGRKARGNDEAVALDQYNGRLCVFFSDGLQLWDVDEDQTLNAFYKGVSGVGTSARRSSHLFAGDMLFLADAGFRSVTTQSYTDNLQDIDVGGPIDDLVRAEAASQSNPIAAYYPDLNQYWCVHQIAGTSTSRVWVFTYSKSSKIKAWSQFELPFIVEDITAHSGGLYLRSGDNVYKASIDSHYDGSASTGQDSFDMVVEFPFLDFKAPGVLKHIQAFDLVVQGTIDVQFRFDPNDPTKITDPITLTGDTRPLQLIPLEITTSAIAPVFTSNDTNLVQLDAFTFYYENLGAF